jgi:hypothetical protein
MEDTILTILAFCLTSAQSFRRKDKASTLILEPIQQLLQLSEWRGRHTGLMAISAVMSSVMEVRKIQNSKGVVSLEGNADNDLGV